MADKKKMDIPQTSDEHLRKYRKADESVAARQKKMHEDFAKELPEVSKNRMPRKITRQ